MLAPERVLPRAAVLVADGRIACVGRCRADGAAVLDCGDAVLSPGFINPHDHLDFARVAPRPIRETYAHRHEWRLGLDDHAKLEDFEPTRDPHAVAWGELRFLVGGTTAVVGGAIAPGLARNLDFAAGLEGLALPPVTYRVFPLDDHAGMMRVGDCDYGPHPAMPAEVAGASAFLAHVAEGTDAAARNEFACESSARFDTTPQPGGGGTSSDWIGPNATLIHALALTPADLRLVAARGASIVWSPRSNLALYGATLDVRAALAAGVNVALGADWLPSGSMDMNRELACARHAARLPDRLLWRMATASAARATRSDAALGGIAVGKAADLALFARRPGTAWASAARSTPQSTLLVWRGGVPLVGNTALLRRLRRDCVAIPVAGAPRSLCPEAGAIPPAELVAYAVAHGLYPLAFAGVPLNEPRCRRRLPS